MVVVALKEAPDYVTFEVDILVLEERREFLRLGLLAPFELGVLPPETINITDYYVYKKKTEKSRNTLHCPFELLGRFTIMSFLNKITAKT